MFNTDYGRVSIQMKEADILPILMKYFKVYRGKEQNYKNIFYCCDELVEKLNEEEKTIQT